MFDSDRHILPTRVSDGALQLMEFNQWRGKRNPRSGRSPVPLGLTRDNDLSLRNLNDNLVRELKRALPKRWRSICTASRTVSLTSYRYDRTSVP